MDPEITETDPLEELADQYDTAEQEEAEARAEPDRKQTDAKQSEGAENLATWTVKALELGWSRVDDRLKYNEQVYGEGREKLGPLFGKYGLGVSESQLPNNEEIRAGFWLGALMKKTWLAARALWENDQREKAKKDGNKRKHEAQESPYAIPSEVGAWEEPMSQAQSPYPDDWRAGGDVGHEQGPPSAQV